MSKNNLPSKELMNMIIQEGKASTSFLTLYSGFKYFKHDINGSTGIIAYVETLTAWVAAGDPVISTGGLLLTIQKEVDYAESILVAFFNEAKANHKVAVLLPLSKKFADRMRSKGYFTIQAGREPWFSLKNSEHPKADLLQRFNVARQLVSKGGKAEPFDPIRLTAREHVELEDLTHQWLESRKLAPLKFLNRLEPWVHVDQKKYFRLIFNGRQVGYLAATPIHGRKAWYLVDLIRAQDCPLGTTELLVAEAMEQLKKDGAEEVTLGMSPLAKVDEEEFQNHPLGYKITDFSFNHLNFFYNFKSLFLYKEKFKPTTWEPQFLITSSPTFGLRASYGLLRAMFPEGVIAVLFGALGKAIKQIKIQNSILKTLSGDFILRSLPKSILELGYRTKVSLTLVAINILFFLVANDQNGIIRPRFTDTYSYQWSRLLKNAFNLQSIDYLILPSFLHFNYLHIIFNTSLLLFVVPLLEVFAGSLFVGIAFVLGMLFSNVLTSLFFLPWIHLFFPAFIQRFSQELDVGSSLGIFSCVAAFIYFLKHSNAILMILYATVVVAAIYQHSLMALNHLIAMAIGYALTRVTFPRR